MLASVHLFCLDKYLDHTKTYNTDSITMQNVWHLHPCLWDSAQPLSLLNWDDLWWAELSWRGRQCSGLGPHLAHTWISLQEPPLWAHTNNRWSVNLNQCIAYITITTKHTHTNSHIHTHTHTRHTHREPPPVLNKSSVLSSSLWFTEDKNSYFLDLQSVYM